MDKADKKRIQKNWTCLKENIDVKSTNFLDTLFESILSEDDFERVNAECTNNDKVDKCLRILFTKAEGFTSLCKALKSSQHDFVLEMLQKTEVDAKEIEEEEKGIIATLKEILHEYYTRRDHKCYVLKQDIEDDVEYEFRQRRCHWEESWDFLFSILKEVFPGINLTRKKRKERIRGIERKSDSTSEEESENERDTSSIGQTLKQLDQYTLCNILKDKFLENNIDLQILTTMVKEEVDGDVFSSLTIDETYLLFPKEEFPELTFGKRKRIINIRDGMQREIFPIHTPDGASSSIASTVKMNHQDQTFLHGPLDSYTPRAEEQKGHDQCRSVSGDLQGIFQSSTTEKVYFRPFIPIETGKSDRERDMYFIDSILTFRKRPSNNLLETVHNFMHKEMYNDGVPEWIAQKSIPFIACCLNERVNGTIHFGVKMLPDKNILKGKVTGIFAKRQMIRRRQFEAVKSAFFEDDLEVVSRCVQPPRFIRVAPSGGVGNEKGGGSKLFVVEIDVIASSKLIENGAFFVRQPSASSKHKRILYRFEKGSTNPMILTKEQELTFMNCKSKLTLKRREQEEEAIKDV